MNEKQEPKTQEDIRAAFAALAEFFTAFNRKNSDIIAIQDALQQATKELTQWQEWIRNTVYPQIMESLQAAAIPELAEVEDSDLNDWTPYLLEYMSRYCKDNGINTEALSVADIARLTDPTTGRRVVKLALEAAEKQAQEAQQPLVIQTKPVKYTDWPLDPFSRIFDAGTLPADQLTIFDGLRVTDADGPKNKEINLYCAIDPTGLNLLEEFNLNPAQRRYYVAMDALARAENYDVSINQIFHIAGGRGPLNTREKREMDEMLNICGAQITVNNRAEADAWKNKAYVEYQGALYPLERINKRARINGQLIDSYIHLFRDAPLLEMARARGQVTTFPPEVLQLPEGMHHTKHNDKIVEYLIYRISHMKSGTDKQRKILWKSVFDYTHIDKKRTQYNKKPDVMKILAEWGKINYIKKAAEDGIAITIELEGDKKPLQKGNKAN